MTNGAKSRHVELLTSGAEPGALKSVVDTIRPKRVELVAGAMRSR